MEDHATVLNIKCWFKWLPSLLGLCVCMCLWVSWLFHFLRKKEKKNNNVPHGPRGQRDWVHRGVQRTKQKNYKYIRMNDNASYFKTWDFFKVLVTYIVHTVGIIFRNAGKFPSVCSCAHTASSSSYSIPKTRRDIRGNLRTLYVLYNFRTTEIVLV